MDSVSFTTTLLNGAVGDIAAGFSATTAIYVFKGTPPTRAQMQSATSSYVITTRSADKLFATTIGAATVSGSTITWPQAPYTTAIASGQATWCAVCLNNVSTPVIFGDVTDPAGNGFLKLNDINIVANGQYKVMAITISLPQNFAL